MSTDPSPSSSPTLSAESLPSFPLPNPPGPAEIRSTILNRTAGVLTPYQQEQVKRALLMWTSPLSTSASAPASSRTVSEGPSRRRLPPSRPSLTRKGSIGQIEFYVIVGFYPDDVSPPPPPHNPQDQEKATGAPAEVIPKGPVFPAEIFIKIAKTGSTLGGMMDVLALTISVALQHGVPWSALSTHLKDTRFEPSGLSLDGKTEYPSLAHAIATTVDEIIALQHSLWS